MPIAEEKLEGPTTSLTYLGININSAAFTIGIPDDKYRELSTLLPTWASHTKFTKQEPLTLIGKLSLASKVVRKGRIFLCRLITLSTSTKRLHHHIYLNKESQADIQWWIKFLPTWNQHTIIPESSTIKNSDLQLFTDASYLGFGAIYKNSWIQASWPQSYIDHSIDFKELFTTVTASLTWGHQWQGKRIIFITDNLPITQIWHTGSSLSPLLMSLIGKLFLIAAKL